MPGNNEFKHSREDAIKWAKYIINNNATLIQASKHFSNIPSSTIWRYIKSMTSQELLAQVTEILEQNKKDSPHRAISKKWENYYSSQSK